MESSAQGRSLSLRTSLTLHSRFRAFERAFRRIWISARAGVLALLKNHRYQYDNRSRAAGVYTVRCLDARSTRTGRSAKHVAEHSLTKPPHIISVKLYKPVIDRVMRDTVCIAASYWQ